MSEVITTPAPGFYPNVPADEYHAWDAASKSRLSVIAEKSPFHLKYQLDHGSIATEAMEFGDGTHAAIFEPERFANGYVIAGQCSAIIKSGENKGRQCRNSGVVCISKLWFCGQHSDGHTESDDGRRVMSVQKGEDIAEIVKSLQSHETAIKLIRSPGWTECSLTWNDLNTDEPCKCRIDRLVKLENVRTFANSKPWSGYGVVDLKTTVNAGQTGYRDFVRESMKRFYHLQSAMYLCGVMNALKAQPDQVRFFLIAVEKSPPYAPCVYEVSRKLLQRGWIMMQRLLKEYAKCRRSGVWPGYSSGIVALEEPDYLPPEDEGEEL